MPTPRKYLPGQLVKVVANVTGHGFAIGQEVVIVSNKTSYECAGENGEKWHLVEKELGPVTSSQTLKK